MAIRIEQMPVEAIQTEYPELFAEVFGKWQEGHIPGFVLLVFDDDRYIGFLSCYLHDANTVYVQFGGVRPEERGIKTLGMWRKAIEILHGRFAFITAAVENKNVTALKLMLMSGFIVNGCRQATNGTLYVEVIRGRS